VHSLCKSQADSQDDSPIPIPSCHLPIPILIRQSNNSSSSITLIPSFEIDRCIPKIDLDESFTYSNVFIDLVLQSKWGGRSRRGWGRTADSVYQSQALVRKDGLTGLDFELGPYCSDLGRLGWGVRSRYALCICTKGE
jgi:hypothetical protein